VQLLEERKKGWRELIAGVLGDPAMGQALLQMGAFLAQDKRFGQSTSSRVLEGFGVLGENLAAGKAAQKKEGREAIESEAKVDLQRAQTAKLQRPDKPAKATEADKKVAAITKLRPDISEEEARLLLGVLPKLVKDPPSAADTAILEALGQEAPDSGFTSLADLLEKAVPSKKGKGSKTKAPEKAVDKESVQTMLRAIGVSATEDQINTIASNKQALEELIERFKRDAPND
jgi:hypothetical protein